MQVDEPRKPIGEGTKAKGHKSTTEKKERIKKKAQFGKTFARMQMVQHLNRIQGNNTMRFDQDDLNHLKEN